MATEIISAPATPQWVKGVWTSESGNLGGDIFEIISLFGEDKPCGVQIPLYPVLIKYFFEGDIFDKKPS